MNENYLIKRPSRNDDDETLEAMQRDFMHGKCKSSAQVKHSGTKPQTNNVSQYTSSQSTSSSEKNSDIPVFFDVVERDVVGFPISEPKLQPRSLRSSKFQDQAKGNKRSLFSQEMENQEKSAQKNTVCFPKIAENESFIGSFIVDGSGLKPEAKITEAKIIHEENLSKISSMEHHEIMEEKTRLEDQLGPDLVNFIRSRRKNKKLDDKGDFPKEKNGIGPQISSQKLTPTIHFESLTSAENLSGDINETVLKKSEGCEHDALLLEQLQDLNIGSADKVNCEETVKEKSKLRNMTKEAIVPEDELPIDPKESAKKWLHMDKMEKDKLAWMTMLPKPQPINLKSGYTARFDFEGKLLSRDGDIPTQKGLHHHANEPEVAGYTIEELFMLTRSFVQSQKISALQIVARILENYWDGRYDDCFDVPLLSTLLESSIAPLLRYALDDSAVPTVAAAVQAMHHLLICKADEVCLDWTFCWQNGHISPFLSAEDTEPNVNLEELTDTNIIKLDVIKGFLRMDVLPRFRYILKIMTPASSVCQLIIEILIRMSRHSQESTKQIADFPGLLDEVFHKFLPLAWTCHDVKKSVDYYPMYSAMKLARVMASASREFATLLVKKYHLPDSLKCYLAIDPSDGKLPAADIQKLMIESLRTWRVLLHYDLCSEIYYEMFPLFVKYFYFCQSLSLDSNVDENVQNYEYAMNLMKTLEIIVEHVTKSQASSRSTESTILSCKDILVFFKMCEFCVKRWLFEFSSGDTNYAGKCLLASCLDLYTSFHLTAVENSSFRKEMLKTSEEIINNLIPFLRSTKFTNSLSHLSSCSILLYAGQSGTARNVKVLTSLGSIAWKEDVIPLLRTETPFPLLSSVTCLILTANHLHKPSVMQMPSELLLNQWLIADYLENFVSKSHLSCHWFDRFEVECIYHLLELFCLRGNVKTELWYKVALSLILRFKIPFALHAEKIMRNVIFHPKFFRNEVNDIVSEENLQDVQNFYCSYFFKSEDSKFDELEKTLSFESSLSNLLGERWCFDPILQSYEQSKQSGAKPLSSDQRDEVKYTLLWIKEASKFKYSAITVVPISVQFCSLCMVFLMDADLFSDCKIQELLFECLHGILSHQNQVPLTKLEWENITDFGEIYAELLVQFESVSYGDQLFGVFVMFPLQCIYPSKWKLLLLNDHPHAVRFLNVPLSKLIIPVEKFLELLETDETVLRCYFKLLCSGAISQHTSPALYLIAIHHLHHFIERSDSTNSKFKASLQNRIKQMKNEDMANVILQYSDQNIQ